MRACACNGALHVISSMNCRWNMRGEKPMPPGHIIRSGLTMIQSIHRQLGDCSRGNTHIAQRLCSG